MDRNNGGGVLDEFLISDTWALDFGDLQNGLDDYFWGQERSHWGFWDPIFSNLDFFSV